MRPSARSAWGLASVGRLLRVGTKGVLGSSQDYGLLVDLQEVASATVAAVGAMEQRYGRFVVATSTSTRKRLIRSTVRLP